MYFSHVNVKVEYLISGSVELKICKLWKFVYSHVIFNDVIDVMYDSWCFYTVYKHDSIHHIPNGHMVWLLCARLCAFLFFDAPVCHGRFPRRLRPADRLLRLRRCYVQFMYDQTSGVRQPRQHAGLELRMVLNRGCPSVVTVRLSTWPAEVFRQGCLQCLRVTPWVQSPENGPPIVSSVQAWSQPCSWNIVEDDRWPVRHAAHLHSDFAQACSGWFQTLLPLVWWNSCVAAA